MICTLVGVPLSTLFVYSVIAAAEVQGISWLFLVQFFAKTASGLAFALAYVAILTLAMSTGARRWLLLPKKNFGLGISWKGLAPRL